MSNQQEIKAKADQAVEMFRKVSWKQPTSDGMETWSLARQQSTQCAIIMYEDRVKLLTEIRSITKQMLDQLAATYKFEIMDGEFDLLSESEAILTELKSRV